MNAGTLIALAGALASAATVGAFLGPYLGKQWKSFARVRQTRRAMYEALWGTPADPEHGIEAHPGLVVMFRDHARATAPPAHRGSPTDDGATHV